MSLPRLRARRLLRLGLAGLWLAGGTLPEARAQAPAAPPTVTLRVVGGLAGLNQFTRHEEPFWARRVTELTGGRLKAEIVPFDSAGLRSQEMLALMRNGAVAFGTTLLSLVSPRDLELSAPDLAGMNPDIASLRRTVAAYRGSMELLLRERGVELLAVYTYPAQMLFCNKPIDGLASLKGLRVRTSSAPQSDWVEALGAQPVTTGFADMLQHVQAGNVDCALTGTMSGYTIGLHRHTTHLYALPVSWGLSVFGANLDAWRALPEDVRSLLRRELARLETAVWEASARETEAGIACATGGPGCNSGPAGAMKLVRPTPADEARRREIFASVVLPRWLKRCGPGCAPLWDRALAPATGVTAPSER